ncbi:MAG: TAT-variant-translocated molybdopterin oxidoreductase [Acidobacteria bacterium]|nr:TAT-variant-translocated molybdopterin oxidoreductase [Acidobacteriota bacterium]MCL5288838.1 TAT-variant-translocated molybdopterin oxidoreductase [Acidobacteriota bacterium]
MSESNPKPYWKCPEERDAQENFLEAARDEFSEPVVVPTNGFGRRNFLKSAGFAVAAATLAGCSRAPVEKAIPFLVQPEEIIPGKAYFYASTCDGCSAACGMLVKNRDSRPIKLEGNPEHPVTRGGLCAVGQASLLGLYDSSRYLQPQAQGKPTTWDELDRAITAQLLAIRANKGAVRFLTGSIVSPTTRAQVRAFLKTFPVARHVVYDPLSSSAILDAHEGTHGSRLLPHYRFERAEVIVSFDADFLGTWISPVEFTAAYRAGRNPDAQPPRMSYHAQFESRMSITGSKADRRIRIAPNEIGLVMTQLAQRLAAKAGTKLNWNGLTASPMPEKELDDLAARLWAARGKSLVVCGEQEVAVQVLCNFINHLLGNYGATLDIEKPSFQRQGSDRELAALVEELRAGKVAALFTSGVNPVFDLPAGEEFAAALKRVPLVASFTERPDETSALAGYVCAAPHRLESWDDAEAVVGVVSLAQPAIRPLGNVRPLMETLAAWMGAPKSAYDLLRERWQKDVFPQQKSEKSFQAFWDRSVHDGFAVVEAEKSRVQSFQMAAVQPLAGTKPSAFSLVLYPKVGLLDGRHAYNPWLQELPDPVTKVTWDNYACLSPAAAKRLSVIEGDVVRLELASAAGSGNSIELPVYVQPGQHDSVVAVALGYGSKLSERFKHIGPSWFLAKLTTGDDGRVGKNAAPFVELRDGALHYSRADIRVTHTGGRRPLACTQSQNTIAVPKNLELPGVNRRPIVQETTLPVLLHGEAGGHEGQSNAAHEMWPADHPSTGHHWAMVVDMNACTGCSACVVACQAENNVPVVGRDEMLRHRSMHWMRIDRYYSGEDDAIDVAHQPFMCQQCGHAPCETVCPVLATVHSEEGLNQQIYNRCVGTRYCANNCPYKTRRFNWFDYLHDDTLQNMALNPDVAVRTRGVMEKCTFCVQRIQAAKIEAKQRGEKVADGAIQTACQQTCPAQAIVFGDRNDPKSRVSQLLKSGRNYAVLGEFNFQPSVGYLKIVRNRAESEGEKHNG